MTLQELGPTPEDIQALRTELDELLRARQFATQRERRLAEALRQSRKPEGVDGRGGPGRQPDPELVRQLAQAQVLREGLSSRCVELSDRLLALEDQLLAEQFRTGRPATAPPTGAGPDSDRDDAPVRDAPAHGGPIVNDTSPVGPQTDPRPRRSLRFGRRKAAPTTAQLGAPTADDPTTPGTTAPATARVNARDMHGAPDAPTPSGASGTGRTPSMGHAPTRGDISGTGSTLGIRNTSGAPGTPAIATRDAPIATSGASRLSRPPTRPAGIAEAATEMPHSAGPATTPTEPHPFSEQRPGPVNPQLRIGHELATLVGRINGLHRRGSSHEAAAVMAQAAVALAPADVVCLSELLRSDGPPGSAGYLARSTAHGTPDHAVGTLAELRRAGLVDEAAGLFHTLWSVPGDALPPLLAALERAGQAADGQTLLWERASASPTELAELAAGLLEAGRPDDVRDLLRQAAGRPIREVIEIAAALDPETVVGLTEAVARLRSATDVSHYAAAIRSDPERYLALLDAVATLDESRARATLAALRSAGLPTERPPRPRSRRRPAAS